MKYGMEDGMVFTEESFWRKLSRTVISVCRSVAEEALTMYFCMKDRDTPLWAKAKIAGALAYFIAPVDLIPDAIPVAGYSDDAAVLALAFVAVRMHIKPEHREKARCFIATIMGPVQG